MKQIHCTHNVNKTMAIIGSFMNYPVHTTNKFYNVKQQLKAKWVILGDIL